MKSFRRIFTKYFNNICNNLNKASDSDLFEDTLRMSHRSCGGIPGGKPRCISGGIAGAFFVGIPGGKLDDFLVEILDEFLVHIAEEFLMVLVKLLRKEFLEKNLLEFLDEFFEVELQEFH